MVRNWFRNNEIYEFAGFQLDPVIQSLRHSGVTVTLTPKVLQTLLILIEHRDRVVSKEEFHQTLWPGIFIDENALAQNIYLLRKVLKEKEPDHDFVENVPKRGYRFRGSMRTLRAGRRGLPILAAVLTICALGGTIVWKSGAAVHQGTRNQEAYNLYLLGRAIWTKRDPARMDQAFQYLRQAVDKDPRFALGWAALADFHAFELAPATEARNAAEWALTLDPDLGEPHTTLGFVSMVHDWDWPAAERHFRRSIELNPRYNTARQWYALFLTLSGRFAEAEIQLQEGLRMEPVSINLLHQRCVMLYHSRQYRAAERECSKVLEIDPVFQFARDSMLRIQTRLGDYGGILKQLGDPARTAFLAKGPRGVWQSLVELEQRGGKNFLPLAGYYMELGDSEGALRSLSRAVDTHEFRVIYACTDPVFDTLRADPRFHVLMQKVCGSQTH